MQEENKVTALIHLSTVHRDALSQRFSTEWRLVVGVCGLLLSVVNADKFLSARSEISCTEIIVLLIFSWLVTGISMLFLRNLHYGNQQNRMCAQTSENELIKLINGEPSSKVEYKFDTDYKPTIPHGTFLAQLFVVLSFLFLISFVFLSKLFEYQIMN
ncbi:hypothetical protein P7M67_24705 [Vibrio parahaemolyticus]|uniref:hypothetical protein n=1 Tax=Vibrio parahaemolyticus TaxID=670 RepID=UPI0011206E60|nr:hypothetical protein [Vibrio parahaemolyticus]MDG2850108.1 hypothetical protein [Vibrio parahaemolyticus]TOB86130.1 hypothetical protein CGJ95_23735 [Vibrio parahaemolyticus]HCM0713078.1 hypothetical protein [Vibrio parahaemolyticus]